MNVVQGGTYDETFGPILDGSGVIVTTAVSANKLTAFVFDPVDADHSSSAVFSYVGAGVYRIQIPVALAGLVGTWAVAITWDDGSNPAQHFADSFQVVAAGTITDGVPPVTVIDANATNTRLAIRRRVSDLLGDLLVVTATANGSTTQFTAVDRLSGPVNAFGGRQAYFTGGTANNLGLQRFVISSSIAGLLTFAAVPHATALGDEIELRNLRNQGWGVDDLHRAINAAISDAAVGFWSPAQDTLATAFSYTTRTLAIPNDYAYLYDVEYQDVCGYWHSIDPGGEEDESGWRVIRGQRVLQINGFWAGDANGRTVRVTGYKRYAPLTADTDTTGINAEWLGYHTAAYLLAQGGERTSDQGRYQRYQLYQSRADRLRDLVNGPPANNTVAVL